MKYCYTTSDCIVAFNQLNYPSDWFSSDLLRQMICRLPSKFYDKWAIFCFTVRRMKEPVPVDFVNWLQDRIVSFKEACLQVKHELKKNRGSEEIYIGATLMSNKSILCNQPIRILQMQ